jgi:hypothetical protein
VTEVVGDEVADDVLVVVTDGVTDDVVVVFAWWLWLCGGDGECGCC